MIDAAATLHCAPSAKAIFPPSRTDLNIFARSYCYCMAPSLSSLWRMRVSRLGTCSSGPFWCWRRGGRRSRAVQDALPLVGWG
jgi:hypothetical protein